MKLLLIEDDRMIGWALNRGLTDEGFSVDWIDDGEAAVIASSERSYDAAILDLGLPGRDGMEVLQQLRRLGSMLPIVVVTARESVADRIKGLDAGADDYICKPFDFEELVARLRAVLRRRASSAATVLTHGNLTLNLVTRKAACRGRPLNLSAKEFALLQILMQHPGTAFTRAQLHDQLYGPVPKVASNTVEVYIHALRRKLGPTFIENVRNVGYRIAAS
jgi:two-component system response regulator QseB